MFLEGKGFEEAVQSRKRPSVDQTKTCPSPTQDKLWSNIHRFNLDHTLLKYFFDSLTLTWPLGKMQLWGKCHFWCEMKVVAQYGGR